MKTLVGSYSLLIVAKPARLDDAVYTNDKKEFWVTISIYRFVWNDGTVETRREATIDGYRTPEFEEIANKLVDAVIARGNTTIIHKLWRYTVKDVTDGHDHYSPSAF